MILSIGRVPRDTTIPAFLQMCELGVCMQPLARWHQPNIGVKYRGTNNTPPTLTGVGHQWTVSTNTGCNQWFSLTKSNLKVTFAGRNRSMMANTSKSKPSHYLHLHPHRETKSGLRPGCESRCRETTHSSCINYFVISSKAVKSITLNYPCTQQLACLIWRD